MLFCLGVFVFKVSCCSFNKVVFFFCFLCKKYVYKVVVCGEVIEVFVCLIVFLLGCVVFIDMLNVVKLM